MNDQQEIAMHQTEAVDSVEMTEQQKEAVNKMAMRHYKKNKKEIDRLTAHSRECLITCNEGGYKYAISKLRDICQQSKLDDETLHTLWLTSKQQTDKIIMQAMEMQEAEQNNVLLVPNPVGKTTPVCMV